MQRVGQMGIDSGRRHAVYELREAERRRWRRRRRGGSGAAGCGRRRRHILLLLLRDLHGQRWRSNSGWEACSSRRWPTELRAQVVSDLECATTEERVLFVGSISRAVELEPAVLCPSPGARALSIALRGHLILIRTRVSHPTESVRSWAAPIGDGSPHSQPSAQCARRICASGDLPACQLGERAGRPPASVARRRWLCTRACQGVASPCWLGNRSNSQQDVSSILRSRDRAAAAAAAVCPPVPPLLLLGCTVAGCTNEMHRT